MPCDLAEVIADAGELFGADARLGDVERQRPLGALRREKLAGESSDLRQAFARLLIDDLSVDDGSITMRGSKAVLARSAAGALGEATPAVLSLVREWRARKDSNL